MNMLDAIRKNIKGNVSEIKDENDDKIINNYDYSSAIPTKSSVSQLIKYLNSVYEYYLWIVTEDESKNYKYYGYQKNYNLFFNIRIRNKKYNEVSCDGYKSFMRAVEDGKLNNIDSMEIRLNISYLNNKKVYDNLFTIIIKPFNLVFTRKSNHNQSQMNTVEDNINEILKRFNSIDSLFCTKQ